MKYRGIPKNHKVINFSNIFKDKYKTPNVPPQNEKFTAHSKNSNEMNKNMNVISPQKAIA